jgi:TPR repeat protein
LAPADWRAPVPSLLEHLGRPTRGPSGSWAALGLALLLSGTPVEAEQSALSRGLVQEATALEHGEGVTRDPIRAAVLYCQAARLGDPEAQYALGFMFANGRGLPRDDAIATALFELATRQSYAPAERMLEHVRDPAPRLPECMREPARTLARGGDTAYSAFDGTYVSDDDLVARLSPDKRRVAEIVRRVAAQHAISPRLALAVAMTESNFDTAARSPKNAQGVMQLIPETAERFKVRNAYDPADNARGGVSYLRWLLAYYRGRVALAVAAYNAGEGAVDKHRGVPPYPETRDYVKRVMATYGAEEHPYDAKLVEPSPVVPLLQPKRR